MILRYVLSVMASLLADFLNLFLAPLVVLFASKEGWLPRWLWWFQTPDNSLDGDKGWKARVKSGYISRVRWLWRNSMYGFAISVLGVKCRSTDRIGTEGNPKISNRPLVEGLVVRKVYRDSKVIYFQWYYVKAWSSTRCIRINLGWKLWGDSPTGQLVFSPNPCMGYIKRD